MERLSDKDPDQDEARAFLVENMASHPHIAGIFARIGDENETFMEEFNEKNDAGDALKYVGEFVTPVEAEEIGNILDIWANGGKATNGVQAVIREAFEGSVFAQAVRK